jgi:hypothetical protein
MIISHKHKFIYIKTRKTAGTSIQQAIEKYCGSNDIICPIGPHTQEELETYTPRNYEGFNGHDFAHKVRSQIGEDVWNEYFTFTFVRNPWDKLISQFWFDFKGKSRTLDAFKRYLRTQTNEEENKRHLGNWFYYTDSDGKSVIVDYIGQYENLQVDYGVVCNRLGIPIQTLPRLKAGIREEASYQNYYDEKDREIIKNIESTKREIEYFKYIFESEI